MFVAAEREKSEEEMGVDSSDLNVNILDVTLFLNNIIPFLTRLRRNTQLGGTM